LDLGRFLSLVPLIGIGQTSAAAAWTSSSSLVTYHAARCNDGNAVSLTEADSGRTTFYSFQKVLKRTAQLVSPHDVTSL
jgi:hypothetical protein